MIIKPLVLSPRSTKDYPVSERSPAAFSALTLRRQHFQFDPSPSPHYADRSIVYKQQRSQNDDLVIQLLKKQVHRLRKNLSRKKQQCDESKRIIQKLKGLTGAKSPEYDSPRAAPQHYSINVSAAQQQPKPDYYASQQITKLDCQQNLFLVKRKNWLEPTRADENRVQSCISLERFSPRANPEQKLSFVCRMPTPTIRLIGIRPIRSAQLFA